jgi:hypothetical protein
VHEEGVLIGLDADVRYRAGHKLVSARVVDLEIHLCGIREPCQLELTLNPPKRMSFAKGNDARVP